MPDASRQGQLLPAYGYVRPSHRTNAGRSLRSAVVERECACCHVRFKQHVGRAKGQPRKYCPSCAPLAQSFSDVAGTPGWLRDYQGRSCDVCQRGMDGMAGNATRHRQCAYWWRAGYLLTGRKASGVTLPRPCETCARMWTPTGTKPWEAQYCSDKCREWWRSAAHDPRRRIVRGFQRPHCQKCKTCCRIFVGTRYVSMCEQCRQPVRPVPVILPGETCVLPRCAWCDHTMPKHGNRRFCSIKCMGTSRESWRPFSKIDYGICLKCKCTFVRRAAQLGAFCSRRHQRSYEKQQKRAGKLGVDWEPYTTEQVGDRDGWRCHLCGKKVPNRPYQARDRDPTVDHLIPRSAGGPDTLANVKLAHNRCNWERQTGGTVQLLLVG